MLTGELKSKIDAVWNDFWSGGISNPLEVIEQITYLLFLRRLDDLHTLEENKSARLKRPMERRVFPEGNDPKGRPYKDLRWSRFKHFAPGDMYAVLGEHVFPFLRNELARQHGGNDSTYAHHMKDARFTTPRPRCCPRWWPCSTPCRWKTLYLLSLHRKGDNLTAHLRRDLYLNLRLDLAGRGHSLGDGPSLYLFHLDGQHRLSVAAENRQNHQEQNDCADCGEDDQPLPRFLFPIGCHANSLKDSYKSADKKGVSLVRLLSGYVLQLMPRHNNIIRCIDLGCFSVHEVSACRKKVQQRPRSQIVTFLFNLEILPCRLQPFLADLISLACSLKVALLRSFRRRVSVQAARVPGPRGWMIGFADTRPDEHFFFDACGSCVVERLIPATGTVPCEACAIELRDYGRAPYSRRRQRQP